jgi:hypothetical protein
MYKTKLCLLASLQKKIKEEEEEEFAFNHHVQEDGTNDSFHDDIIEYEHNVSDKESIEEDADDLHWRTLPPIDVYHQLYGYNVSDITYPSRNGNICRL